MSMCYMHSIFRATAVGSAENESDDDVASVVSAASSAKSAAPPKGKETKPSGKKKAGTKVGH